MTERRPQPIILLCAAYAVLLSIAAFSIPLRIPEILALAGARQLAPHGLLGWIAQSPELAPLFYIFQWPVALAIDNFRIGARLLPLAFAVGACYGFFHLAKQIPLPLPHRVLIVFMLLPMHVAVAIEGRPFEQSLLLLIVATILFLRLVRQPARAAAAWYAAALTLCLYTYPYSYLPAIGYALFLFRFVNRARERKAMWHTLAATVAPLVLYLPYYFWAKPQVSAGWFSENPALDGGPSAMVLVAASILAAGTIGGAVASWRLKTASVSKRIGLFSLVGGVAATLAIVGIVDNLAGQPMRSAHLLGAAPAAILLLFATFEWISKQRRVAVMVPVLAALVAIACAAADAALLTRRQESLHAQATAILPELQGDACVVFVSQQLSEPMFLLFEPRLARYQCLNFAHHRIVLASHPYVRADQQQDVEAYFHALNFQEAKRVRAGGGQVLILDQSR